MAVRARARPVRGVCVCAPLREGARGDHTCVAVCAHRRPGRHVWRTVRHVCQVSARGWPAVLLVANLAVVVMRDSCTGLFPMTPCRCTVELVKSALFKSGDGFSRVLTYFIIAALGVSARCWHARCLSAHHTSVPQMTLACQVRSLNEGLRQFDALLMVPTYQVRDWCMRARWRVPVHVCT